MLRVALNRWSQYSPAFVAALAVVGLLVCALLLTSATVDADLQGRAELATAVATMFALFAAIVAITTLVWVESSDFKAQQAVKADTAQLRAALRSVMIKGALLSQKPDEPTCLDFAAEREALNRFLNSTTAFGYWTWVERKGAAALREAEATGNHVQEPWRLFFLQIAALLDACEPTGQEGMISQAVRLEKLLADMDRDEIEWISSKMKDLAGVGTAEESADIILSSIRGIYGAYPWDEEDADGGSGRDHG